MRAAAPPDDKEPPEQWFQFLGLVIVRKADLLAATAFLLALISTVYQFGGFLSGPHISAFAPDRVVLIFDHYSDGSRVTRALAQVTFTNTGQTGRDGTIKEAWVDISGAGLSSRQYWISFPKLERNGEALTIDSPDDSYPFQVPGENTVSKLIGFAPRIDDCDATDPQCKPEKDYIPDLAFMDAISAHVGEPLTFKFQASTFQNGDVTPSSCKVVITKALISYLAANDWYAIRCAPSDAK
jgi:hypothetical protein